MGSEAAHHISTMGKGDNGGFSEEQLEMYKECFKLMDVDKDGTISKNDIRGAFDNVGKLMSEGELDDMLAEVGGACTFDAMIKMFQDIWPAAPTTPTTSLFVPSRPTSLRARLRLRCSGTHSRTLATSSPRLRLTTSSASSKLTTM